MQRQNKTQIQKIIKKGELMKRIKDILLIAIPTMVCAAAGSAVTALNKDYLKTLKLPAFYPPAILFAIA